MDYWSQIAAAMQAGIVIIHCRKAAGSNIQQNFSMYYTYTIAFLNAGSAAREHLEEVYPKSCDSCSRGLLIGHEGTQVLQNPSITTISMIFSFS